MTTIFFTFILFGLYMYIRESMWGVCPSMVYVRQSETEFLGFQPKWDFVSDRRVQINLHPVKAEENELTLGQELIQAMGEALLYTECEEIVEIERPFGTNGIVYYNKLLNRRCSTFMPKEIAKSNPQAQLIWLAKLVKGEN